MAKYMVHAMDLYSNIDFVCFGDSIEDAIKEIDKDYNGSGYKILGYYRIELIDGDDQLPDCISECP